LRALSAVNFFTDKQLESETGKVINGKTLRNMSLIHRDAFKKLSTDISESRVMSNLMEDFPPICKKDPIDVQMHFITDHFQTYDQVIRLEYVPEEMYGGTLPVAKSRKSKRKETSKEEYLEGEQLSKKAKKEKASDKLKIGGSGLPTIQEEVQDLDTDTILNKRTRSGKAATSTQNAPKQPPIPKKKRKPTIRKLKESRRMLLAQMLHQKLLQVILTLLILTMS
jgi:hypothetical protein